MATNIINAKLGCPDVTVWADWAWQYDYGQILKLSGVDLPAAYEVHFSNQETGGATITQIGNEDGVTVPDEFFLTGADIYVWIFLHAGLDDGETVYKVVIPVKDRPKPSNETPTPVQQDAITEAIAALNEGVERAEAAANEWENMSATAETLPAGSSATASYSEGVLTLGIPKGDTGAQGETGPAGQDGRDGVTPDFSIGTVSTLPTGSSATASITGTTEEPVLNLGIPQGQQGETGATGATGPTGATPNLTIGTVSTLPAGSDATATITGTAENPVLSLGIPKGDAGEVTEAELTAALLNKADVITDTASGSIVSITDGMASPVLGLSVDIEPIQDLHGYDNPWPAGGGKNKTDYTTDYVPTVGINNGLVRLFGITLKPGTYTFSCKQSISVPTSTRNTIAVTVGPGSYQYESAEENYNPANLRHTKTFTVTEETTCGFYMWEHTPSVSATFNEWQVEESPSFTGFAPYSNTGPISGRSEVKVTRTGKNLFDKSKATLGKFINDSLQEVTNVNKGHSELIPAKPSTAYFMNGFGGSGFYAMLAVDSDMKPITWYGGASKSEPFTATTPSNCRYIYLNFNADQIDTMAFYEGNTNKGYIPFDGQTVTIQLGQIVYGGTVDVTEGKLTITHKTKIVDGTTLKVDGLYSDNTGYTGNIDEMYSDSSYAHQRDVMVLCDKLKASAHINIGSTPYGVSQNGGRRFIFNIPDLTTVAQYNAWLQANTPTVYYLLADPIEVSLTPEELEILYGDNNIFADSGDVSVDYRADTKLWILKKIAQALNA